MLGTKTTNGSSLLARPRKPLCPSVMITRAGIHPTPSPSSTVTRSNNQSALIFCARTPGRPGTPSSAGRVLSPRARRAGDSCRACSRFQRPSERRARPGNRARCGATSGPCGAHHPLKPPSPILHPNYSFPQTISSRSKTTHANCTGALSSRACVASNLASPPRHRRDAMRG